MDKKLKIIDTPYPINISDKLIKLLESKKKYIVSYPKIRRINDVFVTYDGIVLKNYFLVNGCAFNLIGRQDNTFYYQFWREAIEKFFISKYGKSIPSIKLDNNKSYLLIHSKWFNYAFWINAFLPRLFQAINELGSQSLNLIAPESWKSIPFVMDTLDKINIEIQWVPIDHQIFIKSLIMPETRKWTSSFNPDIIRYTRSELVKYVNINLDKKFPQKIYLTRSKRGNRCASNEDELMDVLAQYGYQAVTFEGLTIWEQIQMMSNATHFISIHGAGLSNLMFMKPNSSVLEIINETYATLEYTFPFWKLANCVDLNYYMLLAQPEYKSNLKLLFGKNKLNNDENTYLVNSNLVIDINQLLELVLTMESN